MNILILTLIYADDDNYDDELSYKFEEIREHAEEPEEITKTLEKFIVKL